MAKKITITEEQLKRIIELTKLEERHTYPATAEFKEEEETPIDDEEVKEEEEEATDDAVNEAVARIKADFARFL